MEENEAYAIAEAYDFCRTKPEAVKVVKELYPNIAEDVLDKMWSAIDAYCDIQGQGWE